MYDFADGYYQTLVLRLSLFGMIDSTLPLTIFTDSDSLTEKLLVMTFQRLSESLVKVITSIFSVTLETRLMVYVRATKEVHDTGNISDIV